MKFKLVKNSKFYFFTEKMMPKDVRTAYKDKLVELDDEAEQVEDILGDISAGPMDELSAARLANIKVRTSVLEEKLEAHKKEMFTEWSMKFFDVFAATFARFKNELISLHLNEEQINTLNECLKHSMKSMEEKLSEIWNDFNKNEEEE